MSHSIHHQIEELVKARFHPTHLELINESDMHSGPPGRESHFKLTVVSNHFQAQNRVVRSRSVYEVLGDLLKTKVHALALHLYTVDEWTEKKQSPDSPLCASQLKKQI